MPLEAAEIITSNTVFPPSPLHSYCQSSQLIKLPHHHTDDGLPENFSMVPSTRPRPAKAQRLGLQHFAANTTIRILHFWSWAAYLSLTAGCIYCLAHILECSDGFAEEDDLDLTCKTLPPLFAQFGTTTAGMLVRFCIKKLRQRMSKISKTQRRAQRQGVQEAFGTSKDFKIEPKTPNLSASKSPIHHVTRNFTMPKPSTPSSFSKSFAAGEHKKSGKRSLLGRKRKEEFMMRLQDAPMTLVVGEEVWLGRTSQW